MPTLILIILAIFFVIAPFYLCRLALEIKLGNILSDVVICFCVGIVLGNTQRWWMPDSETQLAATEMAKNFSAITVLVAIPMLLMVSDVKAFLRYAPKLILSFALCVLSVAVAVVGTSYWYRDLPEISHAAGMMTGVYIGGTPNMVGISYAVNASEDLFLVLTTTDLFVCGIYFLFLTSAASYVFGLFLPKFQSKLLSSNAGGEHSLLDEQPFPPKPLNSNTLLPLGKAFGLAVLCIGISIALALLIPNSSGKLNEMLLMIVLTTLSIGFSFVSPIRNLKGVYNFAQYLLLIFAIAVGFMADFSTLANQGIDYLLYNGLLVLGLLVLHLLLAMIFRIDRDTYIITSSACVFGPPFIGQICSVINNKELLAAGMALGVFGLIIGNYIGIIVFSILESVF